MTKRLEGKVAIVTGSGQGIGRGIAVYLAREGAKVITNNRKPGSGTMEKYKKGDIPDEDYKQMLELAGDAGSTAELINMEGGEATPFYGDVSDWATAEKMVNLALDTYGSIDIIVNNAAGMGSGSVLSTDEAKWDLLANVREKGAFNLMHFAVPYMIKKGYGRIVNTSSEAWTGLPDNIGYSASTAGIVGLTWAAGKELWNYGITVNAFCPQGASPAHAVEYNAMVRNVKNITGKEPDPNVLKVVEENHGDPVGIGPVIAFLCTEQGSYISGSVFSIYASGVVKLYSNPTFISEISKKGELWTIDELEVAFREQLLGKDYVAPASVRLW
ncbi:SDR family NAD(P)-dependent oxidoreductase [Paradesulfitobacterium ferrireducens]|uniref:SDR family NAD(P)-dependent oxidoreductase n=1 Tax=Paradesulfitobacterium ferrireducens TaxID=2816476 RepID=UPI001A8F6DC1|nr:SDR family NAD(P)-dependent oxidoreductase [Paradesulfitobacterium ferrireducens]